MSNDSDDIGYGKPPKKHRFQKGKSGNPKGRPKQTSDFHTVINDLLSEQQKTKNGEILSKREIYVASLFKEASEGKLSAFKKFIDMLKRSRIIIRKPLEGRPIVGPSVWMDMDEWKRTSGRVFFEKPEEEE